MDNTGDHDNKHSHSICERVMTFWSVMWGFILENKVLFCLYAAFILCLPIKDVLVPHLVGKLYACVKSGGKGDCLMPLLAILVVIMVTLQVLGVLGDFVDYRIYPAIQNYVRNLMMRHQFNEARNGEIETGALMSHMLKMPDKFYSLMESFKVSIIPSAVTLVVCTVYIGWITGPRIGLLLLACFLIPLVVGYYKFDDCAAKSLTRDVAHSTIYAKVNDIMSNVNTVVTSGTEEKEIERIDVDQAAYTLYSMTSVKCSLIVKYIAVPLILSFIAFLCWHLYRTKAPESQFVSLLIVSFVMFSTIMGLTETYKNMVMKWGSVQNSMSVFTHCRDGIQQETIGSGLVGDPGFIEFINVTYAYPDGKIVFDNRSFKIELGQVTVIKGQIGSGKSTFISLLLKLQVPQSGEIWWDGVAYSSLRAKSVRKRMFLVPQNPRLMNRSLYENIVYGLEGDDVPNADAVMALIEKLDLVASFLSKMPDGLSTQVGVGGSKLSGGQQQITVLIKLFLSDPEVVLLDEPTSNLDEDIKELVMNLIVMAMKGRTVVVVTHDPLLLEYANDVVHF